jgi:hypothetical protein
MARALVTLLCPQFFAVRKAVGAFFTLFREPCSFVETIRVDDERVSLPPANGISQEAGIGSLRKRPSIRPYRAPCMPHFEELKRPVGQLEELESIVIGEVTRPAHRIAAEHGILPIRNGCSGCRILGLRRVVLLLP